MVTSNFQFHDFGLVIVDTKHKFLNKYAHI